MHVGIDRYSETHNGAASPPNTSFVDDARKRGARGVKFTKMCKRAYVVTCTQQVHVRVAGRTCTAVSVTSDQ